MKTTSIAFLLTTYINKVYTIRLQQNWERMPSYFIRNPNNQVCPHPLFFQCVIQRKQHPPLFRSFNKPKTTPHHTDCTPITHTTNIQSQHKNHTFLAPQNTKTIPHYHPHILSLFALATPNQPKDTTKLSIDIHHAPRTYTKQPSMTSQIIQPLTSTKILNYRFPITHHSPHTGNTPYNTLRQTTYRTTYTVPPSFTAPHHGKKTIKTSISNAPLSLPHTPPIAISAFQLTNTIPTATTSPHSALQSHHNSPKKTPLQTTS